MPLRPDDQGPMLSSMAATTGRCRVLAVGLALSALTACSGGSDGLGEEPEAVTTASVSVTTTTIATPSTTEPTSTTLSELELAEAEVQRIAIEWYQAPIDTSAEDDGPRLDLLTGLLRQRVTEFEADLKSRGRIHRARAGAAPIEITDVTVDLKAGTAEIEACTGSADEFLDAETLEVSSADDPSDLSTSKFQLELVDGEWKINEWLPSGNSGDVEVCEIGP
jgi:hypothetical protein